MKLPKIELSQKPVYIKFAQDIDFYELFEKIEQHFENCFILESLGEESRFSRYSIIGFEPSHIISAHGNAFVFDGKKYKTQNPYLALGEIVPQNAIARNYAGGLIGHLGYNAINYFEPSVQIKDHPLFDPFLFGVYKDGLILDKMTNELYYFYYSENRIETIKKIMKNKVRNSTLKVEFIKETLTKKEHKKIVEEVKEYIRAGNTFQCQIGFKSEFKIKGDVLKIYKKLRKINPSPFMYYIKFGSKKMLGASPELLFGLKNGEMTTFPLAGTIRRGRNEEEDKRFARKLLSDPKEIAEHNMLVDLHRNDIGKVAQFGTVKVRSLMDVKKFSHVQHISSEIVGIMQENKNMFETLAANFPAGTLSGAPKIESMKIIERLEKDPRGPYGGAIGHFGFNGDCTFPIAIRSLFVNDQYAFTQASGGIVYDSKPEKEYDEVQRKLAAIKEVLK